MSTKAATSIAACSVVLTVYSHKSTEQLPPLHPTHLPILRMTEAHTDRLIQEEDIGILIPSRGIHIGIIDSLWILLDPTWPYKRTSASDQHFHAETAGD